MHLSHLSEEAYLSKYKLLIMKIARKYETNLCEFDDLFQEGSIALFDIRKSFNPDRGTSFMVYATAALSRRMDRYKRKRGSIIRMPEYYQYANKTTPPQVESLSPKEDDSNEEGSISEIQLKTKERGYDSVEMGLEMRLTLSDDERFAIEKKIYEELGFNEIQSIYDVTPYMIKKNLSTALRKLKRALSS